MSPDCFFKHLNLLYGCSSLGASQWIILRSPEGRPFGAARLCPDSVAPTACGWKATPPPPRTWLWLVCLFSYAYMADLFQRVSPLLCCIVSTARYKIEVAWTIVIVSRLQDWFLICSCSHRNYSNLKDPSLMLSLYVNDVCSLCFPVFIHPC